MVLKKIENALYDAADTIQHDPITAAVLLGAGALAFWALSGGLKQTISY